jgi:putative oxidoreductase
LGILAPIGRFLFSLLFIMSGMNHFMQYEAMAGYARSSGVPSPEGALLLAGFLVVSALMMHRFWGVADAVQAQSQLTHFFKNLALAGGALLIVYFGPGPYSLGRRAEGFASRINIPLNRRG